MFRIFYAPTFPDLICTNYLPDFVPVCMQNFFTEKYALRVNFLILIV